MPEIAPFRAVRYSPARFGKDHTSLIAPPYDVLSAEDKAALLSRSDRNIVAVDLPHVPPESAGPDEVYAAAAERLADWMQDGTLLTEDQPSIYVYHQSYEHGGRRYTRRKFFEYVWIFGGRISLICIVKLRLLPITPFFGRITYRINRSFRGGYYVFYKIMSYCFIISFNNE